MVESLLGSARTMLDDTIRLRRRIHRRPEVGLILPETQQAVVEALSGLSLDVTNGRETSSVVADLEGAHPGPTVLLRGDMDALPMPEDTGLEFASEVPGAMHACGHDSHVAMLATAARLLAERRQDLHGRVRFMFQPGEEGYHGARFMIEEGVLDGNPPVSAAFAIHINSYLPPGQLSTRAGAIGASSDKIVITVRGRGGHASAPHRAADPIPVAAEIVLALQQMITRRVNVFDPAVITIAHIESGSTNNVIPEVATMEGTVRALTDQTRGLVLDSARLLVHGIAGAHGLEADLEVVEGYPPTINDADMAAFALDVARQAVGDQFVGSMEHPQMGAEDFSYVLQLVPGAMVRLGAAPPGVDPPVTNHSNRMVIEESAMANGVALYAGLALQYLDGTR